MDSNLKASWKGDGKCTECRRQKYCKKACKANVKLGEYLLQMAVSRALFTRDVAKEDASDEKPLR